MWKRGETRRRYELPGSTPSRPCEKRSRAEAAWIASVQLMNASTITSRASLWAAFPNDAVKTVFTGSASLPLVTSVMLGTESVSASTSSAETAPPTPSVMSIARGMRRDGFLTSSATSPHASKP